MTPQPADSVRPAAEAVVADDTGLDIKDLIGILRRRKTVIISTVLLVTTLGAGSAAILLMAAGRVAEAGAEIAGGNEARDVQAGQDLHQRQLRLAENVLDAAAQPEQDLAALARERPTRPQCIPPGAATPPAPTNHRPLLPASNDATQRLLRRPETYEK